MKLFKYPRLISLSAVVALGFLTWTPATSNAAAPTATLHIVETVINDYGGTAVASDFTLHVRYLIKEVAGSPAMGVAAPGRTFCLLEVISLLRNEPRSLENMSHITTLSPVPMG
jgi:hypothetical protein